jgi:hypothetical protein
MTFQRLWCNICGKSVSTEFEPVPTKTPDKGIIIRALIVCPECMEEEIIWKKDLLHERGSS